MADPSEAPDPQEPGNPYQVHSEYTGDKLPVVTTPACNSQTLGIASKPQHRLWSAITGSFLAIGAGLVASMVVLMIVAVIDGGAEIIQEREAFRSWFAEYMSTSTGLLVVVLPGQLVFLGAALFGGMLSPQPLRQRLLLVKGRYSIWSWFLFAMATPCVAMIANLIVNNLNRQPSQQLEMLEKMFQMQSQQSVLLLLFMMCVVPGIAEELLFRGYLQGRLLERLSPFWAIVISTSIFAAAHLDLQHAIGVIPLGFWLGVVAWRAGSVWPAILCHIANNAFAILASLFASQADEMATVGIIGLLVLACSAMAFTLSMVSLSARAPTDGLAPAVEPAGAVENGGEPLCGVENQEP